MAVPRVPPEAVPEVQTGRPRPVLKPAAREDPPAGSSSPKNDVVEQIARELQVNLPAGNLPLSIKFIALFTLAGGVSIIGGAFADIFNPSLVNLGIYLVRLLTGVVMIAITYGLIHRQRSAVWFYGFMVFVGLLVNPVLALFPLAIVVYLYTQRHLFSPSIFDEWAHQLDERWTQLRSSFRR